MCLENDLMFIASATLIDWKIKLPTLDQTENSSKC